jgi:two-component system secretion response regulator SsrB
VTTVLVVDDTPSLRHLARMAVELAGWVPVGEAENGREGVRAAYELGPDVIVLDHQMPVLDGLSALPLLRRASPFSRIVIWSSDEDITQAALAAGASAVVDKKGPLDHLLIALALVAPTRASIAF